MPIRSIFVSGYSPLAPPLGELSPKVTERVLHPGIPSPSSLRSATSPIGRGKGVQFISAGRFSRVFVNLTVSGKISGAETGKVPKIHSAGFLFKSAVDKSDLQRYNPVYLLTKYIEYSFGGCIYE